MPVYLLPLSPRSQLSSALVELEEVTEEHQSLSSSHQHLLQTSQSELSVIKRQSVTQQQEGG